MDKTRRSEIKQKAKQLLVDCGLDGVYPIPVEKIPSSIGYSLVFFEPGNDDELLNISGAVNYDEKKIFINKGESFRRQTFTMAHELGHAILHPSDGGKVDYRGSLYEPSTPQEAEANFFAAELLMPEHQFEKLWAIDKGDTSMLSSYFFVSEKAIEIRAKYLKLIK